MKKVRTHTSRGALAIMALFLASSGALRVGSELGAALANSAADPIPEQPEPATCPELPSALAKALSDREGAVTAREKAMSDKEAALALANQIIDQRMNEMAAAEAELRKTLKLADGAAEEDLKRLTSVYEAMKPKDAAQIFSSMAPEFASGFLGRMNPESAAAVLAGMDPEQAYSISVMVAGRNALVPKN